MSRLALLVTAACALGAAGASCASDDGADALERQLPALVAPQDPSTVREVRCPAGVPEREGASTRCRATIDGVAVEVQVERRAGDAAVRLDAALVVLDDVEATVGGRLTADLGVGVVVRCDGARVRVAADSTQLACTATDPSNRGRPLRVTVDAAGRVEVAYG